ncbi:MAG: hypothetical protein RR620_08690 [Clostridium sp.]
MDKDKNNFLDKKLNLEKATKLYLKTVAPFVGFIDYHKLMLDYLYHNKIININGVLTIENRIEKVLSGILYDEFTGASEIDLLYDFIDVFVTKILNSKHKSNVLFTTLSYLTTKESLELNLHSEFETATKYIHYYYDELVEFEDAEWMFREMFEEGILIKISNFNHHFNNSMLKALGLKSSFDLNNSSAYLTNSNDLYVCILENDCNYGIDIFLVILTLINFGG